MADNAKPSTEQLLELRNTLKPGDGITAGAWYDDFKAVKAEAEKTGKPMIAMWINPGCGFCKRFCTSAMTPKFDEFVRGLGAFLWLGSRTDGNKADDGREFVFKQSESDDIAPNQRFYFPGVAVWQCEAGHPEKVLHDYRASGRVFEKEKSGEEGVANVIARIQKALEEPPHKEFVPPKRTEGAAKAQGGGCPGGHPHLKVIQQIAELIRPFAPVQAAASASPLVRFNPDLEAEKRLRIVQAISDNGGHCPCKKEKTPDTLCLCKEFRETGKCSCGLFARTNG